MPRQVGAIAAVVITGSTAGVTGGPVVPSGSVMAIWNIEHSSTNDAVVQNVVVKGMPSGTNVDAKRLGATGANSNIVPSTGPVPKGLLGANDVLQVTTTQSAVFTKIVFSIEDPANFLSV